MMNSIIDNSICAGRPVNFFVDDPDSPLERMLEQGIFLGWVMCDSKDYGEIPYALIETAQGLVEMIYYFDIRFPFPLLDSVIAENDINSMLDNGSSDIEEEEEEES